MVDGGVNGQSEAFNPVSMEISGRLSLTGVLIRHFVQPAQNRLDLEQAAIIS